MAVASTSAIDVAIIMIKNILCAVSHLYVVEIYYVEYWCNKCENTMCTTIVVSKDTLCVVLNLNVALLW